MSKLCCSQLFLGAAEPWGVMANWGGAWGGDWGGGGWGGGGWSSSSWGGGRSGGGWGESGSSRGRSRGARRGAGSPGSPPTPPYPQSRRRAGGGLSPQRGSRSHPPLPKGQGDRPRTMGAETHTQAQPSQIYLGLPLYFLFLSLGDLLPKCQKFYFFLWVIC